MITRHAFKRNKSPSISLSPDFIAESVHSMDFPVLKKLGIKACFIDLDNTVVERSQFEVSKDIKKTLKKSGMDIYIATNRPKSRDLKDLKESLGAKGVIHPHGVFGKPLKRYFINAINYNNLKKHEVVMIGDRYIQDIFGANRAGIYSLLVHKLGGPAGKVDRLISGIERRLTKYFSKNSG